jgi:acyl-homoserine lactone acylase PvdQ
LVNGKNETFFAAGAQHPGVPGISIGRSKHISWGLTAALSDVSDLYREKIDDSGTKYFVDNEWKDL